MTREIDPLRFSSTRPNGGDQSLRLHETNRINYEVEEIKDDLRGTWVYLAVLSTVVLLHLLGVI